MKEKDQKGYLSTRFEALNEVNSSVLSAELPNKNTQKGPTTEWRKKDVLEAEAKTDNSARFKEQRRKSTGGQTGERSGSRNKEQIQSDARKGKDGAEEREAGKEKGKSTWDPAIEFTSYGPIFESGGPKQKGNGVRKRSLFTRLKITSPILKRKQATRAHNLVIGSISSMGLREGETQNVPTLDGGKEMNESRPSPHVQKQLEFTSQGSEGTRMETAIDELHDREKPPDMGMKIMEGSYGTGMGEHPEQWYEV